MLSKSNPSKHIVLYADDDPDDLMLVKEALTRYSEKVEVVTVCDGKEVLSYLESLTPLDSSPCLIILDINMPRLNGKEALKSIRKLNRFEAIPIVLFTTSSFHADREFANDYKAGFITKPLDVRQLEIIADQFIDHCTDEIKKSLKKKINEDF